MTKAPTPTEMSKGQSDNTNNATKKVRLNKICSAQNLQLYRDPRGTQTKCETKQKRNGTKRNETKQIETKDMASHWFKHYLFRFFEYDILQ